jgi:hypothetical protein
MDHLVSQNKQTLHKSWLVAWFWFTDEITFKQNIVLMSTHPNKKLDGDIILSKIWSRRPRNTQKLLIGLKSRADAPKTWEKKSNKTTTPIRDNVDEEIECLHDIGKCQNPKAKDASRRPTSLADRWNLREKTTAYEKGWRRAYAKIKDVMTQGTFI